MTEAEDRSGWVKRPMAAIEGTGCTLEDYQALYARSIEDSDTFWAGQADRLDWIEDPTVIANWSYDPVSIKWFEDGVLNICHNAVDRHVAAGHGASTALIFEPDDPAG
ncbi:MAG TPA: acetyl-coenzyme A synthetase, partial [Erythrobacter sp.]|nr:acetyl-coenzyme A synthetase [Erythrobacter sp.]